MRYFLLTWLKKQWIDDALIQPYSGQESRKSLEIYSRMSIGEAQEEFSKVIDQLTPLLQDHPEFACVVSNHLCGSCI